MLQYTTKKGADLKPIDFLVSLLRVAPNDILSNLFLEDLEKIWELRKWIPDPCNPHFHNLKPEPEEEI